MIRSIQPADYSAVVAVDVACHPPDLSIDAKWLSKVSRRLTQVGILAEHKGQVIGYCMYELCSYELRLMRLAVLPEARRQGFGTRLVAAVISRLSAKRRRLVAVVEERNLPAQLFLKRLGLRCVAVERDADLLNGGDLYRFESQPRAAKRKPQECEAA